MLLRIDQGGTIDVGVMMRVGFELSRSRPLARLVAGALVGQRLLPRRDWQVAYVPPAFRPSLVEESERAVEAQCIRVLRGVLLGEQLDVVAAEFDPDVAVWTPSFSATSRPTAVRSLEDGVAGGDTLTEVTIVPLNFSVVGSNAYLEWRLVGRFSNPCFVADDVMLEPSGRLIEMAGVLALGFSDGRAVSIRCYYDELSVLEQLLEPT